MNAPSASRPPNLGASRCSWPRRWATIEHENEALGIRYATQPDVYDPSDDSWLLAEAVQREPPGRLLELGTGAGVVAIAAARVGHRVVATDLSAPALWLARDNARRNGVSVHFVRANLAAGLRIDHFDLVACNPPYLPTLPQERVPGSLNAAFDGGLDGLRVVKRLLEAWPPKAPPLLLVATTLQAAPAWRALVTRSRLHASTVEERAWPNERLAVVRLETAPRKG